MENNNKKKKIKIEDQFLELENKFEYLVKRKQDEFLETQSRLSRLENTFENLKLKTESIKSKTDDIDKNVSEKIKDMEMIKISNGKRIDNVLFFLSLVLIYLIIDIIHFYFFR